MNRRTTGWVGLGAVVAATALVAGALVLANGSGDAAQRVSTEPPIRIGAEPAGGPALEQAEAERVVRTVLDPEGDPVAAAAAIDADDAADLLGSLRDAARTGGVTSAELVSVAIEAAAGDVASVDASIATSGGPAGSGGVHVRHITLTRRDGTWRMTREAACGIAAGGGMLATPPACTAPTVVHRVASVAEPLRVMAELPGTPTAARWDRVDATAYGSELVAGPAGVVAVEYPGTDVGGGGPVGPVELVRLDPDTGRETGRMRPGGEYATVVVGSDAIWVLAGAPVDPSGAGGWGHFLLTRVDASTFRATGQLAVDGELGALLAVSGDTAWVHHVGGLQRIEGPDPHVTGTVTGVPGFLGDDESLTATPDVVVVQRRVAGPGLLVDAASLVGREVDLPDGRVLASGDDLWVTGTSAQRLDADGSPGGPVADLPFGGQAVADGRGGLWLTGEVVAGWTDPQDWAGGALRVTAVRRPVAVHLDPAGTTDATLVAAGVGPGGQQLRFTVVGDRVALWGSNRVAVYEP